MVNATTLAAGNTSFTEAGGCRDQIAACNNNGNDTVCSKTKSFCNGRVLEELAGDFDVYYVPTANPDPYPPDLTPYLTAQNVTSKIGAFSNWSETNIDVYGNFARTGDWMRTSKPDLETVINAGVRSLLFFVGNYPRC